MITSSLHVTNILAKETGIRLMVTGGTVTPGISRSSATLPRTPSRLRFDTLVMGVAGVDAEVGCTEFSTDDAARRGPPFQQSGADRRSLTAPSWVW